MRIRIRALFLSGFGLDVDVGSMSFASIQLRNEENVNPDSHFGHWRPECGGRRIFSLKHLIQIKLAILPEWECGLSPGKNACIYGSGNEGNFRRMRLFPTQAGDA